MKPEEPRKRQTELWSKIVETLGIDLGNPISFVSAKQVGRISAKEARNMAYMDHRDAVPLVFQPKSNFLLPISNGRYAIVRGIGYHDLEVKELRRHDYEPTFPPGISNVLDPRTGEHSAVVYAQNIGLLSHASGVNPLIPGSNERFRLDEFEFKVDGSPSITQSGAQAQVDGFYYGSDAALLMEFKNGFRSDFLIRQLYYPYRHWLKQAERHGWSQIRPFFVDYRLGDDEITYRFFEYSFPSLRDYESIELVGCDEYVIPWKSRPLRGLLQVSPDPSLLDKTPQADDIERVLRVPFIIDRGNKTSSAVASVESFTDRQASYYRRAAELLGLVIDTSTGFELTDVGREYVTSKPVEANEFIAIQMMRIPVFHEILRRLAAGGGRQVIRAEISSIVEERDKRIHGSTVPRRVATILSWLRWLQTATGVLTVDAQGTVRPTPRLLGH